MRLLAPSDINFSVPLGFILSLFKSEADFGHFVSEKVIDSGMIFRRQVARVLEFVDFELFFEPNSFLDSSNNVFSDSFS